ncbi:hypothetical protein [Actinomadura madurae]|uniref:hypothetical protein n=1 Tax=Actinomadura madurae TaxID=1993 RepID=UPI0020D20BEE|nr:hypothetical protein [Actinomadura madurae]MCQ0010463.1 hypothetical protein [Actinomadura madurae]MCQ0014228.1 hypothetical protein [Actinomadura madurae]
MSPNRRTTPSAAESVVKSSPYFSSVRTSPDAPLRSNSATTRSPSIPANEPPNAHVVFITT